jgi:sarcosine oxidase
MGSAILAHCAARGANALGFDQYEPAHSFGSSSGKSRLIRKAYFEDARYVPLLERAYELWRKLEAETNEPLLQITGLLLAGKETSAILQGTREAAKTHGLKLEYLTSADVARRFPAFKLQADECAVLEPEGGALAPEAAVRAHLLVAARHGGASRFGVTMVNWTATADGCRITLSDSSVIEARVLVLALGPWFQKEMEAVGVALRLQRNIQAWFSTPAGSDANRLPCFLLDRDGLPAPLYGFPDQGDGLKAAFHGFGELTDPANLDREINYDRDVKALALAVKQWIPHEVESYLTAKACIYSLTPDENFVIDQHPNHPNVILCGGFSGHGFKFAPVVGEIGADLALSGGSRHDIKFLSLARFSKDEPDML